MTNPWMLFTSVVVGLISGLFSGLLGRCFEDWFYRPRLEVDFIPNQMGFYTEGYGKRAV